MPFIQQRKGAVLVVVGALVLLFAIAEASLFSIVKYRLRNLEIWMHSTKAYYLLESAATVALMDIRQGKIGEEAGKWTERDVAIPLGERTYPVHYAIKKSGGNWFIETTMSLGDRLYHLRIGGLRAFPFFIRGFGSAGK